MSYRGRRPFRSESCSRLGLGVLSRMLDAGSDIIELTSRIMANRNISRLASSPSAARKIHEMITTVLDRIATEGSRESAQQISYGSGTRSTVLQQFKLELANTAVFAKYQSKRGLIDPCYADIIEYIVRQIGEMLEAKDPSLPLVAKRARIIFDALIVGVAGRR